MAADRQMTMLKILVDGRTLHFDDLFTGTRLVSANYTFILGTVAAKCSPGVCRCVCLCDGVCVNVSWRENEIWWKERGRWQRRTAKFLVYRCEFTKTVKLTKPTLIVSVDNCKCWNAVIIGKNSARYPTGRLDVRIFNANPGFCVRQHESSEVRLTII